MNKLIINTIKAALKKEPIDFELRFGYYTEYFKIEEVDGENVKVTTRVWASLGLPK